MMKHHDRFPRSLNEAFGPYAGTQYVSARRESRAWWILGVALLGVLVALCFSQA